ncbi:MAG: NAD(P)/FAD-dependent oxidoreductase [Actinobacteria bacterium]|nr:NAD(P)/FAD-dependent oxidoreductase [Actinomycetota bacterium]
MSQTIRTRKRSSVAVIGGGIAGQAVIEAVREQAPDLSIKLFCAEDHAPYDRVRLTELIEHGRPVDDLRLRPDEWYADHKIEVVTGTRVSRLDTRSLTVYTNDDAQRFGAVCLATGSEAMVPPIEGADKPGVFLYRYPGDCEQILGNARPGARAAVIGGGLLGLEAAKALVSLGCRVTVVHLMDRLMERQLDATAAAMLLNSMQDLSVEVLTEHATVEVTGEHTADGLRFADGDSLACDFIVVSVGVTPRIDLAKRAGLTCERGVVVDDRMQASAPDVFAVGECAQHDGIVHGIVAPIYDQAQAAAAAIARAKDVFYTGSIPSAKLKVMGVDLVAIGNVENGETVTFTDPATGVYRKLAVSEGQMVGAVLMGDTRGHELLLDIAKTGKLIEDPLATLARASEATAAELPDGAQVCNCNGVCKGDIVSAIRERGLTSIQEVVAVTRAGAGCGSCKPLVSEILKLETGDVVDEQAYLCPCKSLTRDDIAGVIREHGAKSVSEVATRCGAGRECGACKPGIAYLVSEINDNKHREERGARFINDRVHANIQKDGTFSVVPRIYGGVTSPAELRRIADVAERYEVPMVKFTGGQRIDLLGVSKEQLPAIWEELGMPSGHAYAKAVRTVKTCVGSRFCRFGIDDAIEMGIELEHEWEGVYTPHKVKAAVSGCPRNCAEASTKDIGLIAVEGGWQVRVGGAAGASVREGDVLVTVETKGDAMRIATTFLQYYREHGEYLERTYGFVERVGLDVVRENVLDESTGEPQRLRERFRLARAAVTDPWLERREPVHPKQFSEIDSEAAPAGRPAVAFGSESTPAQSPVAVNDSEPTPAGTPVA